MLCSLLKRELLGFFGGVMSCFFGCFGLRTDDRRSHNFVSKSAVSKTKEPFVSRNHLSSLLQAEEEKEDSGFSTPEQINETKILKDQARFLKACGTIAQTPVEFKKEVVERYRDVSYSSEGSEPFRFHSWLPNASIEKLDVANHAEEPPTPIKFGEGWVQEDGEEPFERTPSSFTQVNVSASATDETSSTRTPCTAVAASEQCRNKSVRFECKDDMASFSSKIGGVHSKQCAALGGGVYSVSKHSPYPTPLKLTDEMQTPGTVFPADFNGVASGKNPRIRSQYVYAALNPVENISQLKLLKEEEDDLSFKNDERRVNQEAEVKMRDPSVEASLSSWLKPPIINQEGGRNLGRTPGDKPIIGLVAAHWNEEEETPRISPKYYWDGNGIPNSTHKYREDQKVSWHATPFEERLEKALSDEGSATLRKDINRASPIDFEDTNENDTALSKLQPSTYSKPMVTF